MCIKIVTEIFCQPGLLGWRSGIFPRIQPLGPCFESQQRNYVDWVFGPYLTAWVFPGIILLWNLYFLPYLLSIGLSAVINTENLREIHNISLFQQQLKTYLFTLAFPTTSEFSPFHLDQHLWMLFLNQIQCAFTNAVLILLLLSSLNRAR